MIPMLEFLGRVAGFSVVVRAVFHGCGVEGHIVYAMVVFVYILIRMAFSIVMRYKLL